jgi:AcrR family transcriptional regulator
MPRQPDPDLEQRILKAAHALWKRGGEKALTMRAVAERAGSNTPAVYRRFRNRQDLLRALLRRLQVEIGEVFRRCRSIEEMAEAYVEWALGHKHEFELFAAHVYQLSSRKGSGYARPIRESRPNVGLLEERLAERLGGSPPDHTRLALALWAAAHGTVTLLLARAIPDGHEAELRAAFRDTVKGLIGAASGGRSMGRNTMTSGGVVGESVPEVMA